MSSILVSGALTACLYNLFKTILSAIIAYYLSTSIYCLTFHPLAGFPGPFASAFSRIPFWIASLKGDRVTYVQKQHKKYGPVYRLSPNELSYAGDGSAWEIHRMKKRENPKAPEWFMRPPNGVANLLYAPQKDHARVRNIFAPAFSERAMKASASLYIKHVDLLVSKIHEFVAEEKPVEMSSMLNFITFDIMGDLAFGQPLGLLENVQYSPWVTSVFESVKILIVVQIIEFYPILRWLFDRLEPKVITNMKLTHWNHTVERVNQRLDRGPNHPDIWSLVMERTGENGEKLTLGEMHTNAELFIMAGSETTATLLTGILFYLSKNPSKMSRLTNEIRSTFKSSSEITFDRLVPLTYLNACLQEGLRIYPPVAIGIPRFIPPGGQVILGKFIPEGTRVALQHYSIYRSPLNFHDPDSFIPERWLSSPERNEVSSNMVSSISNITSNSPANTTSPQNSSTPSTPRSAPSPSSTPSTPPTTPSTPFYLSPSPSNTVSSQPSTPSTPFTPPQKHLQKHSNPYAQSDLLASQTHANDNRASLQPFGLGPRACIGQNMALHEMRLILARLLFDFEFEVCEESQHWDRQKSFVLWEKKALFCRVVKVVERAG